MYSSYGLVWNINKGWLRKISNEVRSYIRFKNDTYSEVYLDKDKLDHTSRVIWNIIVNVVLSKKQCKSSITALFTIMKPTKNI